MSTLVTMRECLIIGCGGHGRQIRNWIDAEARYRPIGWLDANSKLLGTWISGLKVLGTPYWLPEMPVALGIGMDNRARNMYLAGRSCCVNVIHPTACVPVHVRLGRGISIGPMGVVDGENVRIGDGAIIHTGAQVHHDCTLGQSVFLGPGAVICGHCRIGDLAMIGANATILPGHTIGSKSRVGAGTTITHDVLDEDTVTSHTQCSAIMRTCRADQ